MHFTEGSTKCMKHLLNEFSKSVDKEINKKSRRVQEKLDKQLITFFNLMIDSYEVVKIIKRSPVKFTSKLTEIKIPEQIPKSTLFQTDFVTHSIKKYINDHATIDLCYKFKISNKDYTVHFILLDEKEMIQPEKYEAYIERIMVWLHMSQSYVTGKCSDKSFTMFFYFTPFDKLLPECSITVIGPEHVNSGVSYACPENGEIVVFRKEEWFKVFIHETFHALGLDFATMNQEKINKMMNILFPIETDVNLFEAYTECWARIFNSLFVSFYTLDRTGDISKKQEEFILTSEYCLQFEANFSVFQMVKVLQCMGLSYEYLYGSNREMELARKLLYKEKTNVFSYYIITSILLSNYSYFLSWCHENNLNLVEFTKTLSNLQSFYDMIEYLSLSTKYLNYVATYEIYLGNLTNIINQGTTETSDSVASSVDSGTT